MNKKTIRAFDGDRSLGVMELPRDITLCIVELTEPSRALPATNGVYGFAETAGFPCVLNSIAFLNLPATNLARIHVVPGNLGDVGIFNDRQKIGGFVHPNAASSTYATLFDRVTPFPGRIGEACH